VGTTAIPELRHRQLEWLGAILEATGWSSARLATAARIHPSTLVHFRRDKANLATLDEQTVARICDATHSRPPDDEQDQASVGDVVFLPSVPHWIDADIYRDILATSPGVNPYLVVSGAMEASGCPPGHIVLVEHHASPSTDDLVVARTVDGHRLLRHFRRPYLFSNPFPPKVRQTTLWDENIEVDGVVRTVIGGRRSRAPDEREAAEFGRTAAR
jgi:hypothetical protein